MLRLMLNNSDIFIIIIIIITSFWETGCYSWGVGKVVATPGVNNDGNCACKFWEEFDALVCRPNVEVIGLLGGTDLWLTVPKFQTP